MACCTAEDGDESLPRPAGGAGIVLGHLPTPTKYVAPLLVPRKLISPLGPMPPNCPMIFPDELTVFEEMIQSPGFEDGLCPGNNCVPGAWKGMLACRGEAKRSRIHAVKA